MEAKMRLVMRVTIPWSPRSSVGIPSIRMASMPARAISEADEAITRPVKSVTTMSVPKITVYKKRRNVIVIIL